jgi:putative aldouronate transport system permease protein
VKRRITVGILFVLLIGSLWMPFFSTHPNLSLDSGVAAAFPGDVSGLALISKGNQVLPVALMPSLGTVPFRQTLLIWGVALVCAGAVLAFFNRRILACLSALVGGLGMLLLLLFSFYFQQLSQSVLFSVMLTVKWYLWIPCVLAFALFILELQHLTKMPRLPVSDHGWRRISAVLCAVALLLLLFPFSSTYVPAGTFSSSAEDALASRSLSGLQWLADGEPLLQTLGSQNALFTSPSTGGAMQSLVTLSDSASSVKNLFMIPTHNGTARALGIIGAALLLIGLALQLIKKVDRWIPTGVITVGALLLMAEAIGTLTVDSTYQFSGAVYQLIYLGLGGYTIFPLLCAGAAVCAFAASAMGIRVADAPYFINPIPSTKRMFTVSLGLAIATFVLLMLPVIQINLYTPGKINQSNPTVSQSVSGLGLLSLRRPDELLNPVNNRGKALYTDKASKNGLTLQNLQTVVSNALWKLDILWYATVAITLASLALLLFKKRNKRLIIGALLLSAALQATTTLVSTLLLPKEVGFIGGLAPLYIAICLAVFAAFFSGFLDREELPKKYKLFLMMLPFLVAVLLFSYLPLSGWRYAFYNYKLGIPMDQQEFVGFKWFTSLWANPAQQAETIRVLRNTFAMSGIGLATAWIPVAFAIFLTEIRSGWFKKFVQIFTTLPNFISWVLVFSFALTIFSLDTGIVNKVFVKVGLIQAPIAYLNSGEHIWIKMWLWSTWKTLGWSAIMYLAAIAGIDQELYEAARVDGAGRWRQIWNITIPGLLPTFFVLLLLQISNIVNNGMEQYLVFQNAMNKSTIEVLDLYVYNISLGTRSTTTISMATAIGILKSLVSIVLLFLANRFSKAVRGESIV